ncbi:hypothetical protein FHW12_003610 [Dokdonella fugitiva]|uniref:Uncharacterized protein n=1 Tax=Dokdonella fugitiva TaxID=328517 RepID=A0A839EXF5_9GAMM|nr:pilin [Dokdonella fugitiva]MBA8889367.1 hypothetical protein [Dokdonella fugitiva]
MKSLLMQFAITFVAIVAALVAYDAWHSWREQVQRPALVEQAKREANAIVSESTAQALEQGRRQAAEIAQQSRKAIEENNARSEAFAAQQQARAILAGDIGATAGVRVALVECYQTEGRWPDDPARCGIDPSAYKGHLLDRVRVEAGGRYVAVLHAGYGLPAGEIRFTPTATGAVVQWNCSTPSYPEIERVLPTCRYEPRAAATVATPTGTGS